MLYTRYARVAQEVEHWSPKPEDVGSKPTLVLNFIVEVDKKMFKPDLVTVLLNEYEAAEARLSALDTAFGDKLAKRGLRITTLRILKTH